MQNSSLILNNCKRGDNQDEIKELRIELNKRFGMPIFIPLVSLIVCFLLSGRRERKISKYNTYVYGIIGLIALVASEITVRYSGLSLNHTIIYYLVPISFLPIIYLFLIRVFKYENLN